MIRNLAILGAGGHGREVLQVVHAVNTISPTWRCIGFVVDPNYPVPQRLHDLPTIVGIEALLQWSDLDLVVAVGDPTRRQRVVERLEAIGTDCFPTLVHPRAWIGHRVLLGAGTIIFAGAMITTDVELGVHVHVNLSS